MLLLYNRDTDDLVNEVIDFLDEDFIRIGDKEPISIEEMRFVGQTHSVKFSNKYSDKVDLSDVSFIWHNGGVVNVNGNPYENECSLVLLESYLSSLQVKELGRPINKYDLTKLSLHLEAQKQGFLVPSTLITGDKLSLVSFYHQFIETGIICKRVLDPPFYETKDCVYDFTLTFSIDEHDIDDIPDRFAISLFQEKISAEFEIRVIFIQGTFFAMAIHAFEDVVDYRLKLGSKKNIRMVPFKLPDDVGRKLKTVFEKAELNYGSADLMFANGDYYFLEINPIGKVGFANNICNFYIEKHISELVKNGR